MWIARSTSPPAGARPPPAGARPSATSCGSIPRASASAGRTSNVRRIRRRRSMAAALVRTAILVEVRTKPTFGLLDGHLAAPRIVLELVAADAGDTEILAVAMAEIE